MVEQHEAWTILRLLQWTTDYLRRHGSPSPRLDAEVLLAHARKCQRIELYTAFDQLASDELRESFRQLVQQRAAGKPVAYLVGGREFFSLDFEVTSDVLIPRPETEFVLVALLDRAKKQSPVGETWRVADVGTGSGILAVCAVKYLSNSRVTAIDTQSGALAVAQRNAARHQVLEQIDWVRGDLLETFDAAPYWDFIVSNPPYVGDREWEELAPDVKMYEPRVALVGGEVGDEIIRRLVAQAGQRLVPGGSLILEISPFLDSRVASWFQDSTVAWEYEVTRDLAQLPRVVAARKLPA